MQPKEKIVFIVLGGLIPAGLKWPVPGNRDLDLNHETTSMSEPGYLLPIVLLLLLIGSRQSLLTAGSFQLSKTKQRL